MKDEMAIIRTFESDAERDIAAYLMMNTSPWSVFGRTYTDCLDAVTNPTKNAFGAFVSSEQVGVIVIDMNGPFKGYLQAVCVDSRWRKQGIGSKLILFAEEFIFATSPNCFLCYSDFNDSVFSIYQKMGYELVGELRNYMIAGHSEFIMRKTRGPIMPSQNA